LQEERHSIAFTVAAMAFLAEPTSLMSDISCYVAIMSVCKL
jgi:hypothetical protein